MKTSQWMEQNYTDTYEDWDNWTEHEIEGGSRDITLRQKVNGEIVGGNDYPTFGRVKVGEIPAHLVRVELPGFSVATYTMCDDWAGWDVVVSPEEAQKIQTRYETLKGLAEHFEKFMEQFE